MAQNKLEDLRNHIFAAMERLGEESLTPEQVEMEVAKAKSICGLASTMVDTAKVEIEFMELTGALKSGSSLFKGLHNQNLLD